MLTFRTAFHYLLQQLKPLYPDREAHTITAYVFEDLFRLKGTPDNRAFVQSDELTAVGERLGRGEPWQYVTGAADFFGLKFKVNSAVLIPRPETAELVDLILQKIPKIPQTVLDVGTGSGCIPVTLKKKRPVWNVAGWDVSNAALRVAAENAAWHQVDVAFSVVDVLREEDWPAPLALDVLVSNPPYIPHREKDRIGPFTRQFEPELALFVPDDRPLLFYETIGRLGRKHLRPHGHLFFECNEYNAVDVQSMLGKTGFRSVQLLNDMQRKPRIVWARQYSPK